MRLRLRTRVAASFAALSLLVAGLGQSILGGILTPDAAAELVEYGLARLFEPG